MGRERIPKKFASNSTLSMTSLQRKKPRFARKIVGVKMPSRGGFCGQQVSSLSADDDGRERCDELPCCKKTNLISCRAASNQLLSLQELYGDVHALYSFVLICCSTPFAGL